MCSIFSLYIKWGVKSSCVCTVSTARPGPVGSTHSQVPISVIPLEWMCISYTPIVNCMAQTERFLKYFCRLAGMSYFCSKKQKDAKVTGFLPHPPFRKSLITFVEVWSEVMFPKVIFKCWRTAFSWSIIIGRNPLKPIPFFMHMPENPRGKCLQFLFNLQINVYMDIYLKVMLWTDVLQPISTIVFSRN